MDSLFDEIHHRNLVYWGFAGMSDNCARMIREWSEKEYAEYIGAKEHNDTMEKTDKQVMKTLDLTKEYRR